MGDKMMSGYRFFGGWGGSEESRSLDDPGLSRRVILKYCLKKYGRI
jgi:hypothetical protein